MAQYPSFNQPKKFFFQKREIFFVLGVLGNLALLFGSKYLEFFLKEMGYTLRFQIEAPLGISFFVFHAISYLSDVYSHRIAAEKKITTLSLYFFLFPHMIAGPIVRYGDFLKDFLNSRKLSWSDTFKGVERLIIGLAKKTLLADTLGIGVETIFQTPFEDLSMPLAWLGMVSYSLQIYFDFSGYSDMAIGLARLFGFHFQENFRFPYSARSITEFWKRWHISLSTWFRDYVYIPLGGNRVSAGYTYLNLLVVFVLCGFWHGAEWKFLIWGLWHGSFLIFERLGFFQILKKISFLASLWTLAIIGMGWIFFKSPDLSFALKYLTCLWSGKLQLGDSSFLLHSICSPWFLTMGFLALIFCSESLQNKLLAFKESSFFVLWLALLWILSLNRLAFSSATPFIYFQF